MTFNTASMAYVLLPTTPQKPKTRAARERRQQKGKQRKNKNKQQAKQRKGERGRKTGRADSRSYRFAYKALRQGEGKDADRHVHTGNVGMPIMPAQCPKRREGEETKGEDDANQVSLIHLTGIEVLLSPV